MITSNGELQHIPIQHCQPGQFQPRTDFNPEALKELSASIQKSGIIQPLFVRPIDTNRFEILAGERRWRAAGLAKLATVPCIVKDISDEDAIAITTIENIQRQDLNPLEEAKAYQRMIDEFGYRHEEVASIVGKSRPKITNLLRLLTLDARAQQVIIDHEVSEGHAKVIAGAPTSWQLKLVLQCIKNRWSVRQLERYIREQRHGDELEYSTDPDVARLERKISDHLGTHVQLKTDSSKRGGRLTVHFTDNEILSGILDKIGVVYD